MKIRNGFVTNSSSSSFVLQFNKVPKTIEEVRDIFFKGLSLKDNYKTNHDRMNYKITIRELCEIILENLKEPQTFDEVYINESIAWQFGSLYEWVKSKTGVELRTFYEEQSITGENITDEFERQFCEDMKKQAIRHFRKNGLSIDGDFYTMEFEDCGREAVLECDEILEQQGIRISRH